jgi:O-antigen ligase
MQNIYIDKKEEKLQIGYLLTAGLIFFSLFAIFLLGIKGVYLAIAALTGLILVPIVYNKTNFFLFLSLFIYPLSRIFSTDDKFIATGALYLLSFPCVVALISKKFGENARTHSFLWGLILYAGVIALNFFRTDVALIEPAKDIARTFYAVFIVLAVQDYISSSPEKLEKLSKYLSYFMNFMAGLSVLQYITRIGGINIEGYYRVRGLFPNSNDYGFILAIFITFAFCNFLNAAKNKEKTYWGITLALNLIILILTFSKTSIINTALALIVMGVFLPSRAKAKLFATIAVSAPLLWAFLSGTGLITSLIGRFSDTRSLMWREELWRNLFNAFMQGNIWFGQGANASRDLFQYILPVNTSIAPHNVYLEQLYNFGIIGIIPFILIFAMIILKGVKGLLNKDISDKITGISIISIALITLIQNYVSNAFYDRAGNIIYWAIIALLICGYKNNFQLNKQTEAERL